MHSRVYLLIPILMSFFFSCQQAIEKANQEFMPPAQGAIGEIILVMDSAQWKGSLGSELRQTFHAIMPGLPQDEPLFRLHYVNPIRLNSVLKQAKNMVFVTILNDRSQESKILKSYFTTASLKRIEKEQDLYMFTKKDDFARGQEILHLFGRDEGTLIANLQKNRDKIRAHFETIERRRLRSNLFESENKALQSELKEQHNFSIRIPYGYELAKNESNFVWIRQMEYPEEKSFFIYYQPYTSRDVFNKDKIVELREKITLRHVRDIQDTDTYMTVQDEKYLPYYTREINLNGQYAFEMRGLWKLSDISAGGPFLSYTTVDPKLGRLYYIEGYVYHPSGDKRDWMREIDAILKTFQISEQDNEESTD